MKQLYLIGGPMGVGKTTVGQLLKNRLENSVFLDGDWCWDANPFTVSEETRRMVMDNICHLLGNFLACSAYRHVIFCWVMHRQDIVDDLLSRLDLNGCRVHHVSLVCSEAALTARLHRDIRAGIRQEDILSRSLERLPFYRALHSVLLDVSELTPEETADRILMV